jgi:hypothetical protein
MIARAQKYSDDEYLAEDWFSGTKGDDDARCVRTAMVRSRKSHTCYGNGVEEHHEVPAGTRVLRGTALVDGTWVSSYLCTEHMDVWLDEVNGMDVESIASGDGGVQ